MLQKVFSVLSSCLLLPSALFAADSTTVPPLANSFTRDYTGTIPVAFFGNAYLSCPPQASTTQPLYVSNGGTLINYDMTAGNSSAPFIICNIGIKYWPTESITTVAAQQYGLVSYPSAPQPCSSAFGAAYSNMTCQMNPVLPPNTSVCVNDDNFNNTYNPWGGQAPCGNGGQSKLGTVYSILEGGPFLTYNGNTRRVPLCSEGTLDFYVPSSAGSLVTYTFSYTRAMGTYYTTGCGLPQSPPGGSPASPHGICGYMPYAGLRCNNSYFQVSVQAGMKNQINVSAPSDPSSIVNWSTGYSAATYNTNVSIAQVPSQAQATGRY